MPSVYICTGFENITATTEDDDVVTFIATGMDVTLPAKDDVFHDGVLVESVSENII